MTKPVWQLSRLQTAGNVYVVRPPRGRSMKYYFVIDDITGDGIFIYPPGHRFGHQGTMWWVCYHTITDDKVKFINDEYPSLKKVVNFLQTLRTMAS